MKKIMTFVCFSIICLFVIAGCMGKTLPDMASNAIEFNMGTFHDTEHYDALFGSIEYNGRTYIAYGTSNKKYKRSEIESCIGYIIQNANSSTDIDPNNTNRRIYTLSGDPEYNYLMDFDDSIKLMNQPTFYRAIDTNGKRIDTPTYIDSLGYEFWGDY